MLECHCTEYSNEQRDLVVSSPKYSVPTPQEKEQHVEEALQLGFKFSHNDGEGDLYEHTGWYLYYFERRSLWCLNSRSNNKRLGVGVTPLAATQNYSNTLMDSIAALQEELQSVPTLFMGRRRPS